MNRLLILSFLLVFSVTKAQFQYDLGGLHPKSYVQEVPENTANEIFTKTIDWIKENYTTPEEVIVMNIENQKIRLQASAKDGICFDYGKPIGVICNDLNYLVELSFKDGKYKIEPLEISHKRARIATKRKINFYNGKKLYNKKGEVKKILHLQPKEVSTLLNSLNTSLHEYLTENIPSNQEW